MSESSQPNRSRPSRRDFIHGKAALRAAAEVVETALASRVPDPTSRLPDEEGLSLKFSRRAMACQFELLFNAGQYANDAQAASQVLDLVEALEAQLTIFRESSTISQINREAAQEPVVVEPRLFGLLQLALKLQRQTEGAFDITAGPLARIWGFVHRAGQMPDVAAIEAARRVVGSHLVELDASSRSVHLLAEGVELNLGSIGKGYALDRCGELLAAEGIHDYLFHGGQSSLIARGDSKPRSGKGGWIIGLPHPLRPEERIAQLRLCNRALATSGSGTQFFVHEGRRYGHVLDPRTGWPAEGVFTATALAPTAAEADALSTAFYISGPEWTRAYCSQHAEVAAVLVTPAANSGEAEVVAVGLDAGELLLQ